MFHTVVGKIWRRTTLPVTVSKKHFHMCEAEKNSHSPIIVLTYKSQCVALTGWCMCLCLVRLVPNLVALILFCTFILPWTGTGPLWNQVVQHHSDVCKNTWWRNLLFIHNYFGFENMVSLAAILLQSSLCCFCSIYICSGFSKDELTATHVW